MGKGYWESSKCVRSPLLSEEVTSLLEEDSVYKDLLDFCNKVKSKRTDLKVLELSRGKYADFRISTIFEDFEFNVSDDLLVYQMLHIPKIFRSEKARDMHKEFSKNLQKGLTLNQVVIYIAEHSLSKYGSNKYYTKRVRRKVKDYKSKSKYKNSKRR